MIGIDVGSDLILKKNQDDINQIEEARLCQLTVVILLFLWFFLLTSSSQHMLI
jgi:hypothetical protein